MITVDKPISGADLIVQTLEELKVDKIFGYPGGAVLPLYDAIYEATTQNRLSHISPRHEQGAVHAAEGYAQAKDEVGVVIVTSGPGATNALTGITNAMLDSTPLVVITGQVHRPGIGYDAFQEADIFGMTTPITKYNYQIRDVREIPRVLHEAFHIANTGRKGPVVIDLPRDMQVNTTAEWYDTAIDLAGYRLESHPVHNEAKLAVDKMLEAERPIILAGKGVLAGYAQDELRQFAETYNIPVVTTLLGLGAMPHGHELFAGMGGMHGSYPSNMALYEADYILNIGSRFDDRVASNPQMFGRNAYIVHVDIDNKELGKIIATDLPILSDSKAFLQAANAVEVEDNPDHVDHSGWVKRFQGWKERHPLGFNNDQEEVLPQDVIQRIGKQTKGEAIVVTDVGQHQMWTSQFYPFKNRAQQITSGGLGTMGFGIPAALGAGIAAKEQGKQVVAIIGDAGFQMTNQELAAIRELDLDVKIFIMNNSVMGMVHQWQTLFFDENYSESAFGFDPDFVKLSEVYEIPSYRIDEMDQIDEVLDKVFAMEGPVLVDVVIPEDEKVQPMVPAGLNNNEMEGVYNA